MDFQATLLALFSELTDSELADRREDRVVHAAVGGDHAPVALERAAARGPVDGPLLRVAAGSALRSDRPQRLLELADRVGPLPQPEDEAERLFARSRAAFALEVEQVSQPVTTRFGVHLIRCDEIKPANKQWTDVRQELEKALARELLDRLARLQQRYTPVKFTGKAPYFKPGTRELVLPGAAEG